MLELQNIILEMVAKGESLKATADRLCIEVESRFPEVICSILTVDRTGHVHPLSAPSLPDAYCSAIEGAAIGPSAGSCGSAAYLRAPVAVTDIESDPRWASFRAAALPLGLKACWSSPIFDANGRVLGTFAFYYRKKRGPNAAELHIVNTCVYLCAIALEREEQVREHERRSYIDDLTELRNRASFNLAISQLPSRQSGSWALLLVDLDNLKSVNDTFGHHAGDTLLKTVAQRIAEAASPHPSFRLGGDEFAVLLQEPEAVRHIAFIAQGLLGALAEPINCDDHVIMAAGSIGAAVISSGDQNAETVRRNADLALYHAKETNPGGFILYAPSLGTRISDRAKAIREVAAAVRESRIDAYYQPIVRLDNRKIIGFEALCRLARESGDVVPAAEFCEATTDVRVASYLTREMLRIVASDVRTWLDMGIPFQQVSVNVASADFYAGHLEEQVAQAFGNQGVPLKHVILEVTESVYMSQRDHVVARAIKAMRAMGIRIALDDFGTGFASLTHLLTVPVDFVKIDKSFIDKLVPGNASSAIVEGLISISRKLGICVVAEGIETERQLSYLQDSDAAFGQGYLFSKPLPREAATAMLLSETRKSGYKAA